jgi:DNA-binding MarR family transcriptional regulator
MERPPAPDPENDTIRHWLKLAFVTMRRELDASMRTLGLTMPQWRALDTLRKKPGITHTDLVSCLEIEAPSVTSLVDGMERKGWVRRERSEDDARVKRLFITPRGRRILETASAAIEPIDLRMSATLSAVESATLKRLLSRIIDGLH